MWYMYMWVNTGHGMRDTENEFFLTHARVDLLHFDVRVTVVVRGNGGDGFSLFLGVIVIVVVSVAAALEEPLCIVNQVLIRK